VDHAGGGGHLHRAGPAGADGHRFPAAPVQRPGVPLWVAGFYGKPGPLRRDAGRAAAKPYDVVAPLSPSDPAPHAAAGATWWLVESPWEAVSVDQVRGVIRDGPAASP
jgi:hypothetical protein